MARERKGDGANAVMVLAAVGAGALAPCPHLGDQHLALPGGDGQHTVELVAHEDAGLAALEGLGQHRAVGLEGSEGAALELGRG